MEDFLQTICAGQSRALEMLARGMDLETVLSSLLGTAETIQPGSNAAIVALDSTGAGIARITAPTLPPLMVQSIERAGLRPGTSPCAAAMLSSQAVWIDDIQTDERTGGIRDLALQHGFRSCWSQPIFDSSTELLGALAIWSGRSGLPNHDEIRAIVQIAHVAGVVLERHSTELRQRQLAEAIESSGEAMILTDHLGRITQVNPAFTRITGFTATEAEGRSTDFLRSNKQDAGTYGQMQRQIERGQPWSGRLIQTRQDGRDIHVSLTLSPVSDVEGNTTGFVGIERDITEDIRREDSLREALHQAEAATKAKTSFLNNMSHEIRTPMTAILGFAELLLDPAMDRVDQEDAIQVIRRNGQHLIEILNGILDLSKIEAGGIVIEKVQCSPAQLVTEATSMLRGRAHERGIDLRVRIVAPFPECIETDPTRFRQILLNLIGNAIKFTADGSVQVQARWTDSDQIEVAVIDTGIGIATDKIASLFQPFTQAEASTTREFGGTGLGLTISQRLVEHLGGTIGIESEFGRGSTFTFTIDPGPLGPKFAFLDDEALKCTADLNHTLIVPIDGVRNSKAS